MASTLSKFLASKIQIGGPITVADLMNAVLFMPNLGYYSRGEKSIIGTGGDFVTSPEISQIFGEIIACWVTNKTRAETYNILELGPGKATLLCDAIRTFTQINKFKIGTVFLLESSESLRKIQESALGALDVRVRWINDLSECSILRNSNNIVLCHEFFDAQPIYVFKRVGGRFHELLVDIKEGRLVFVDSNAPTINSRVLKIDEMFPEHCYSPQSVEVSPKSWKYAREIAKLAGDSNHAIGLIVDYGYYGPSRSSLRAIKGHQLLPDPLVDVGEADLSVDVDFRALDYYLKSACSTSFETQRQFLLRNHIEQRARMLSEANPAHSKEIDRAVGRLINESEMGNVYKFLCFEKK